MKVLIDIPDNKQGQSFLRRAKALSYVQKAEKITASEIDLLVEIKEIKEAYKLAAKLKAGQIKSRPARDLLSEL